MENAIRPIAVGRKNWLFSDTPEGAVASTTIYSIIETAKANGLEPYWYLRVLLKNLPQLKTTDDFRPFTPQNIDKSLVQTEKEKYR
jgi:transposase